MPASSHTRFRPAPQYSLAFSGSIRPALAAAWAELRQKEEELAASRTQAEEESAGTGGYSASGACTAGDEFSGGHSVVVDD